MAPTAKGDGPKSFVFGMLAKGDGPKSGVFGVIAKGDGPKSIRLWQQ